MSTEKLHALYEKLNDHLTKNVQGFNGDTNGVSNDPAEDMLDYALAQVEKANQEMGDQSTITQGYARLADVHRLMGNFLMMSAAATQKNFQAKPQTLPEYSDPNQIDIETEDWGNGFDKAAKAGNPHYISKAETPEEEELAWRDDVEWDERQDLSPVNQPAALERKIAKQHGVQIKLSDIGRETKENTTFTGSEADLQKLRGQAGAVAQATGSRNQVRINPG